MSIEGLIAENQSLKEQNGALRHELDQLKRLIFGANSERLAGQATAPPEQMALWGQSVSTEPAKQKGTYRRGKPKKAHPGRASLP